MGRRLNALLEVSLFYLIIVFVPMVLMLFHDKLTLFGRFTPNIVIDTAWSAIILALLVLTKRDLSVFGITLRNLDLNLNAVAIWVIPLCAFNTLSAIDMAWFNTGTLESILLLSAIELLIIFAIIKVLPGGPSGSDKITLYKRILIPAAAIGSLIVIPAIFMPAIRLTPPFTLTFLYVFIQAFIFVGPVEELVFRGYAQSRLNEVLGRPYRSLGVSWGPGLVIASLLFGLIHVINSGFNPLLGNYNLDPVWGIAAFVLGMILGFVREKTGSLVAPAILHGALDFIV